MNNGELILAFEGRNLCSRVKVLVAVDRPYRAGEVVELEIVGVVNRGELANDDLADDSPETLPTGCSLDDTFVVCGELFESPAKTVPQNDIPEDAGEEETQG